MKQWVGVQFVVKQVPFGLVVRFHCRKATLLLDPFQRQHGHINGVYRRGIVHAVVVDVCGVLQHRRDGAGYFAQQVFAHDHQGCSGRSHVFLSTSVDQSKFFNRNGTAKHVGRHIAYNRHLGIWPPMVLCTVDGVVAGQVQVLRVRRHFPSPRNEGIILIFGRGQSLDFTKVFGFFGRFICPTARIDVASRFVFVEQIHRRHEELGAGSSRKEHYCIFIAEVQQLAYQLLSLSSNGDEVFAAVGNL